MNIVLHINSIYTPGNDASLIVCEAINSMNEIEPFGIVELIMNGDKGGNLIELAPRYTHHIFGYKDDPAPAPCLFPHNMLWDDRYEDDLVKLISTSRLALVGQFESEDQSENQNEVWPYILKLGEYPLAYVRIPNLEDAYVIYPASKDGFTPTSPDRVRGKGPNIPIEVIDFYTGKIQRMSIQNLFDWYNQKLGLDLESIDDRCHHMPFDSKVSCYTNVHAHYDPFDE